MEKLGMKLKKKEKVQLPLPLALNRICHFVSG